MNVSIAIEEFLNYTKEYIALSDNCTLKVDHTMRVMDLCSEIAESLNLSSEDIELAKLCGLLHDIGRFEQWKRYESFNDSTSVDHADLGVEVLTTDNYIKKYVYDDKYIETVLNSVKFHNKYKIDEDLSDRDKLFCKIVRDADKIDILYLYTIGHIEVNTCNEEFSDKVYDKLLNKEFISMNDKKTKGDILSITLGFVFDINFKKSFEILKERGYLDTEIDIYKDKTENEKFKDQLENVRKKINEYMEEKL